MAFVPGAAGGAMRACPPERSTTRSHSAPPVHIPDANSLLLSARHELIHGAQPTPHFGNAAELVNVALARSLFLLCGDMQAAITSS